MTEPARRDAEHRHEQQQRDVARPQRGHDGDHHQNLRGQVQRTIRGMTMLPQIVRIEGVE